MEGKASNGPPAKAEAKLHRVLQEPGAPFFSALRRTQDMKSSSGGLSVGRWHHPYLEPLQLYRQLPYAKSWQSHHSSAGSRLIGHAKAVHRHFQLLVLVKAQARCPCRLRHHQPSWLQTWRTYTEKRLASRQPSSPRSELEGLVRLGGAGRFSWRGVWIEALHLSESRLLFNPVESLVLTCWGDGGFFGLTQLACKIICQDMM